MNRFRKFCALGWEEKKLFCESLLLHLFVGLLLKVVPFRRIPRLFSSPQFDTPAKSEDQSRYIVSGQQAEIVEKIRVAVQRAGWVSPWRNRCLVSSLAARLMVRRRKIASELSLGVSKDSNKRLRAHAWIISGELEIIPKGANFIRLKSF